MARCKFCSKGLLAADRKRKRCGRCGLSITEGIPQHMTKEEQQARKSGKAIRHPWYSVYFCNDCNHKNHKKCDDQVMVFCQCRGAGHDPSKALRQKASRVARAVSAGYTKVGSKKTTKGR
jgi:hypothetical protein